MQKWGQRTPFQVAHRVCKELKRLISAATASGLQIFSELEQFVVGRACQKFTYAFQMFRCCQSDIQANGRMAQDAIECHAHGEIACAAHASGCDACDMQAGDVGMRGKRCSAVGQTLEDECRVDPRLEGVRYRRFARGGSRAGDQGGKRQPFFDSLFGSTPSCLSLRYRCVRSSPVFSATRVMLPPSRIR